MGEDPGGLGAEGGLLPAQSPGLFIKGSQSRAGGFASCWLSPPLSLSFHLSSPFSVLSVPQKLIWGHRAFFVSIPLNVQSNL